MPKKLFVDFLDVGQGDGILVHFPDYTKTNSSNTPTDGTTMLIDLGSTKNKNATKGSVVTYIEDHTKFGSKNKTLDYLVVTHGDIDHYNMLYDFLTKLKIKVNHVIYGGYRSDYTSYGKNLWDDLDAHYKPGHKMKYFDCPSSFPKAIGTFGNCKAQILEMDAPTVTKSSKAWRKNTSSVVVQLEYGSTKIMLTGDATWDTEQAILQNYKKKTSLSLSDLESYVLKVQHHGSARTSLRPSFVSAVRPSMVFISSDRDGEISSTKKTGHRLPQELALDLIADNTTLETMTNKHKAVSSYDFLDYHDYKNPDTGKTGYTDKHSATTMIMEWMQHDTKQAMFTSLSEMDKLYPDGKYYDVGVHFQMQFQSNGDWNLYSTTM